MIASHSRSSLTACSCSATAGRDVASTLVTMATFFARGNRSSCSLMYLSPGPIFSFAGTHRPMTSTSASVSCTIVLSRSPSSVRGRCIPGVSTMMSWPVGWCTMPRMARRVVCGLDDVIATFSPTSALVSVDLPTLGRPDEAHEAGTERVGFVGHFLARLLRRGVDACVDRLAHCPPRTPPARRSRDWSRSTSTVLIRLRRPSVRSAVRMRPEISPRRPGERKPADRLGEQAADRVDIVILELDAEQVAEFVDGHPRRDPEPAVAEVFGIGHLAVVLVGDVADELLDEVLERDQPGDAAVLVDHHCEVVRLGLHQAQRVIRLLRLRHEERLAGEARPRSPSRGPCSARTRAARHRAGRGCRRPRRRPRRAPASARRHG